MRGNKTTATIFLNFNHDKISPSMYNASSLLVELSSPRNETGKLCRCQDQVVQGMEEDAVIAEEEVEDAEVAKEEEMSVASLA